MIKKLQRRFIEIVAAALLLILILVVSAIAGVNIYRNHQNMQHLLEMLIENKGQIPVFEKKSDEDGLREMKPRRGNFLENEERSYTTRFCTVELSQEKEILSVDDTHIAAITEEEIEDYAARILEKEKTSGWIDGYVYRLEPTDSGYFLVILDGTSAKKSNVEVLAISAGVAAVSFFFVMLIVILCAGRAIRPIAESYEKQKRFITDASHELKTPITVISANAELLKMSYGEDEWIDGIEKQTVRMRDLVNQLVQLSKMDEGQETVVFQEMDLSGAVYDTAKIFEGLAIRQNKGYRYEIVPEVFIKGDEAAIRQLVSILLDNAVKYCDEEGEIRIELKMEKQAVLTVSNSYSQVGKLELARLTDRFYRADTSRTQKGSYGLGLSIAQAVVMKHHARLHVKNLGGEEIQFQIKFQR